MKKFIISSYAAALMAVSGINSAIAQEVESLKVLMIGNSFSICVRHNLPQIVDSFEGKKLLLCSAYIGGCPLNLHVENIANDAEDFKPYTVDINGNVAENRRFEANLPELLKMEQWDVVTIQQASPKSWDFNTYEPYAGQLIEAIRQMAPSAEIVIQQTWSYRNDHAWLKKGSAAWKFDQAEMAARVADAYRQLAEKYQFRVIPVGDAVQNIRSSSKIVFFEPEREQVMALEYPKTPSNEGDVVGGYNWWGEKGEAPALHIDEIHLNPRGEYLQACTWFQSLYGIPAEEITYCPDFISKKEAAALREAAGKAVREYRQCTGVK